MIRLRNKQGKVTEIPAAHFVEVCDEEGNVAQLTYQDVSGGVHVIREGDPETEQYCRMFPDVKFVPIIEI